MVKVKKKEGGIDTEDLIKRDREEQREMRWKRIEKSKSCSWYKKVKKIDIPEYLKKGWGESRWR